MEPILLHQGTVQLVIAKQLFGLTLNVWMILFLLQILVGLALQQFVEKIKEDIVSY